MLKSYSVFSIDQIEGSHLDHLRAKDDGPANTAFIDFQPAEQAIAATEAVIKYQGDRAFYHRGGDYIQMPPKNKFPKESDFYATSFHELAHWSEKRTGWEGDYAINELRAEIAAAYMLAELGVPQSEDLSNHQAYLKNWLQRAMDLPFEAVGEIVHFKGKDAQFDYDPQNAPYRWLKIQARETIWNKERTIGWDCPAQEIIGFQINVAPGSEWMEIFLATYPKTILVADDTGSR